MTDEKTRVKRAHVDSRIIPRVVILDPELTLATPPWLWASTGVKALDHALEALWSPRAHPLRHNSPYLALLTNPKSVSCTLALLHSRDCTRTGFWPVVPAQYVVVQGHIGHL